MWALWVQLVAGGYLFGLIWIIQGVHYPLFGQVPAAAFPAYETAHQRRIFPLVFLPMLADLLSAAALPFVFEPGAGWVPWAIGALASSTWVSTAFVQVPLHGKLSQAQSAEQHQRLVSQLVRSNWLRTAAWTLKFGLVCYLLALFSE